MRIHTIRASFRGAGGTRLPWQTPAPLKLPCHVLTHTNLYTITPSLSLNLILPSPLSYFLDEGSTMQVWICEHTYIVGGGRWLNQVGLINRPHNISIAKKLKSYGALWNQAGLQLHSPTISAYYGVYMCAYIYTYLYTYRYICNQILKNRPRCHAWNK